MDFGLDLFLLSIDTELYKNKHMPELHRPSWCVEHVNI